MKCVVVVILSFAEFCAFVSVVVTMLFLQVVSCRFKSLLYGCLNSICLCLFAKRPV